MNANQVTVARNIYGTQEQLGLVNPREYHAVKRERVVPWTTKGLKITRLRLLTDPGFPVWDVSYCHGVLPCGEHVRVELPFSQLPRGPGRMKGAILAAAKADGLYAVGTGVFHAISTLN